MSDKGFAQVAHQKPYKYQEGELQVTRGSAWSGPGCHLGCGVLMYSDKNGLVKVEGDPENPYNQGRLCVRCLGLAGAVNHPDRLLYPLKRAREDRGKNIWERISWAEALDTVEERFNYYKSTYGAESVTFWQGTGRDIAPYISRLAWSFDSPNYTFNICAHSCYAPRIIASAFTTGVFWVGDYSQQFVDRFDNPEWECPDTIIVWGNNPLIANSDGAYGHWVIDCMQRGSRLAVVDSQLTWLAAHSDVWLQPRPGTDAAVALAMANVIIGEEIYNKEFVDLWTYGFDEYAQHVAEWTPERAEDVTWVPAEKIRAAARLYARSPKGVIQWGVALDQREDCMDGARAIVCLMMLTGSLDQRGGMIKPPELLTYITGWGREFLSKEQDAKRLGADHHPFVKVAFGSAGSADVIDALLTGEPYQIRAAWLQTVNPLACGSAETETTIKAFANCEFTVCADIYMTPTIMALADIVLPVTTFPERNGIRIGDGCQRGETINKAVEPRGECRSDQEICLELGRRFNPEAWPWKTVEEMFTHIVAETGYDFHELQDVAPCYLPFEYEKYKTGKLRKDGTPGFPTTTGRAEFYSLTFEKLSMSPMPVYEEPALSPVSEPEVYKQYPYILTTGTRQWNTFHSENRQVPHLRAIHPEPLVRIHPDTAKDLALDEGDWVWLEGPIGDTGRVGRAKRKIELFTGVDPRVLNTEHGWWHPEGDPEKLFDALELNINNLITWKLSTTSVGANHKALPCKVYKVKEGE